MLSHQPAPDAADVTQAFPVINASAEQTAVLSEVPEEATFRLQGREWHVVHQSFVQVVSVSLAGGGAIDAHNWRTSCIHGYADAVFACDVDDDSAAVVQLRNFIYNESGILRPTHDLLRISQGNLLSAAQGFIEFESRRTRYVFRCVDGDELEQIRRVVSICDL